MNPTALKAAFRGFPYESGVVSLFKLVRAEIVQQVQTVIGKVGLTLVFLLVVHYFGV